MAMVELAKNSQYNRQNLNGGSSKPQIGDRCDTNKNRFCQDSIFLRYLDMFNVEIISYKISQKSDMEQIYDMFDKVFTRFDSLYGLILYSNQGIVRLPQGA